MIFSAIIVVLFAAIAIINNTQNKQKTENNPYNKTSLDQATIDQLDDPNYQNLILPEKLAEAIKNKEDKTVYFYSPTCVHCQNTTPIVAPLAEEMGIDLVQYNLLEFEQGWEDYRIESTPTIVHFNAGVEYDRIIGYNDKEVFEKWFKENKVDK